MLSFIFRQYCVVRVSVVDLFTFFSVYIMRHTVWKNVFLLFPPLEQKFI